MGWGGSLALGLKGWESSCYATLRVVTPGEVSLPAAGCGVTEVSVWSSSVAAVRSIYEHLFV